MSTRPQVIHDAIDLIADAYGIDRAALAAHIDEMADEAYMRSILKSEYPRWIAFMEQYSGAKS